MNKNYILFLLATFFCYCTSFAQVAAADRISENEFFTEKEADNPTFLVKVYRKYQNEWVYVDYETGDETNCKQNTQKSYKKGNDNFFEIINKDVTKTDIWVSFVRILGKDYYKVERKCFVKYNESYKVKNLEAGDYKLIIKHGTHWKQPIDFSCKGRFIRNNNTNSFGCTNTLTLPKNGSLTFTSTNEGAGDCDDNSMISSKKAEN